MKLTVTCGILALAAMSTILFPRMAQAQGWTPSPSLLARLAPVETFDGLSIRPPVSFVRTQQTSAEASGVQMYFWQRPGNTSTVIGGLNLVTLSTPAALNSRQFAADWIKKEVSKHLSNITNTAPEDGSINGTPFTRVYYKGQATSSSIAVHGFVYVSIFNGHVYLLEAVDTEPNNSQSLPIAEAAVETFSLQSGPAKSTSAPPIQNIAPALLAQLSAETQIGDYKLRSPKGYQYSLHELPDGLNKISLWQGPSAPGVTPPAMVFRVKNGDKPLPLSEANEALKGAVDGLREDFITVTIPAQEAGTINGLSGFRLTYTATKKVNNQPVVFHGVFYSLIDGSNLIVINGLVSDPSSPTTLSVIDAAMRTLHK